MDNVTYKCSDCRLSKPTEQMTMRGHTKKPSYCKACTNIRSKKSYENNKNQYQSRAPRRRFEARELIVKEKSKPCTDCSEKFHFSQMDFDHRVQSDKRAPISRLHLMGLDSILLEIAKCDLVCANCHRDRTQIQPKSDRADRSTHSQPSRSRNRDSIVEFVNALKHEKPCADCKEPHPYWRLDFDHREGSDKLRTISRLKLSGYTKESILAETAKCDLVCARCHRLRTWNRQRAAKMGVT